MGERNCKYNVPGSTFVEYTCTRVRGGINFAHWKRRERVKTPRSGVQAASLGWLVFHPFGFRRPSCSCFVFTSLSHFPADNHYFSFQRNKLRIYYLLTVDVLTLQYTVAVSRRLFFTLLFNFSSQITRCRRRFLFPRTASIFSPPFDLRVMSCRGNSRRFLNGRQCRKYCVIDCQNLP